MIGLPQGFKDQPSHGGLPSSDTDVSPKGFKRPVDGVEEMPRCRLGFDDSCVRTTGECRV